MQLRVTTIAVAAAMLAGLPWIAVAALAQTPVPLAPAAQADAAKPEPTISKTEFIKALQVYDSNSADNSTRIAGPANMGSMRALQSGYTPNGGQNSREMRYQWFYAHWDHKAHKPVPLMNDVHNGRAAGIEDIVSVQDHCVKIVAQMDAEDHTIPARIPISQVNEFMDQWAFMTVACVNKRLSEMRGEKDVIAIICFQDNKHCFGPKEYPDEKPN